MEKRMVENEPIIPAEQDNVREQLIKHSGSSIQPDDPILALFEVMIEVHKEFCEDIKNKNMMAVADALLTQQRFLKGYQKTMEHGLDYVVERFGTVFLEKLNNEATDGLKRNEAIIRDGMNTIYGEYQQHLKTVETLKKVVIVLIVLAALGVGGLYALLLKLFLLL